MFNRLIPGKYFVHKISRIIKKNNYDFVWLGVNQNMVKIGLGIFKMKLNTKYIHERSEFSWIAFPDNNKLHQQYLTQFLPQIDNFVIMTSTLIDYYKDFVGNNTRIMHLPMTVDFSRFEGEFADNQLKKPYIAYCGSMDIKKDGVDILINSFFNIMNDFPELHLYIAGPLFPKNDYLYLKTLIESKIGRAHV